MGSIVSRGRRAATSGGSADPAAGRAVAPRGSRRATWALGAVCALLAAGLFSWMSVGQWERWDSPSWDLAIFSQLAQDYAHLRAPIVDIKGHGFNLLGDHFHPLLILLGPVWALWPSGLAVMITQDALLGLGAGILAGFGTRFLGWARGLCLGTAFTLSFGVLEAVRVQFHEVAFAVPLLAMSLCLLALRRLRAAAGWAAPLVFVKEDLGITVAVIGLVILWTALRAPAADGHGAGPEPGSGSASEGSGEQRSASGIRPAPGLCSAAAHRVRGALRRPGAPTGIILACWGLAWSVLAVSVILPALNPHGTFDYADKVDVPRALGDPLQAFAQLFTPEAKLRTWGLLLLSGAVVFLRSPLSWVGLPTLVWRFLSPNEGYWGPTWHYSLVLMPVLFAAVFDAALRARAAAPAQRRRREVVHQGDAGDPGASGRAAVLRSRARATVDAVCAAGPVLAAVLAVALVPSGPLAEAWRQREPDAAQRQVIQARQRAVEHVPEGVSVAADLSVLTRLVPGRDVHWIGTAGDPAPEYLVLQTDGATWGGRGPADPGAYAREHYGASYDVVFRERSVVVLRRA
ncbi:DUF2079 domain-containing protein [Rothia kristinae]|uniref:DUF2079 domain-containing protein n=1 Tax=Rothia kristinae TaxID=37923 RepID=A0A7T3CJ87_9MICC|nr:DUF2079 domain-containing protein [Rothia kristinae]QPT53945.1 DUF2079 domain-containing protein [Rothia kristinae]